MTKYDRKTVIEMEDNLAGALLADAEHVFPEIRSIVSASDFLSPYARDVYNAVDALITERKPTDAESIFLKIGDMEGIADREYCKQAIQVTATLVNSTVYAQAVHQAAASRTEEDIAMQLIHGEMNATDAVAALQELSRKRGTSLPTPSEDASEIMDFVSDAAMGKGKPFVPTGFSTLDRILSGGLMAGGLITVAARPGTGKTTAGICIAESVAMSGTPILYVSLEMTRKQIWTCRIANYSGVNRSEILTGRYSGSMSEVESKQNLVVKSIENLSTVPFYLRDIPSSLEDIERDARGLPNVGLIVIDHMGLIRPPEGSGKGRYEVMTEIAHRLKQLALSLQIPILSLCQLNRASLERQNKRPTMADLRDSGAIEEDSDAVILLFRDMEDANTGEVQKIKFIVDKNRHGEIGDVDMKFLGSSSRIVI